MRTIIGIDPGLDGAVAVIHPSFVKLDDAPTVTIASTNKREYDVAAMRKLLEGLPENAYVVIEKSQAFPDQGAVSNFSTGHGFGLWRGLIVGLGMPYEMVRPHTWKRAMGLDNDKARSILLAKQLFPATADQYRLPNGRKDTLDGRAEALLLAEWVRRKLGQEAA